MANYGAPPGWYPDPAGSRNLVYWNGYRWLPPEGVRNRLPKSFRLARNILLVLGGVAAFFVAVFWIGNPYFQGFDCGGVFYPTVAPDPYLEAGCQAERNSSGQLGAFSGLAAFILFSVAITIHFTGERTH